MLSSVPPLARQALGKMFNAIAYSKPAGCWMASSKEGKEGKEGQGMKSSCIISKVATAPGLSETACDQLQNRSLGVYL